MLLRLPRPIDHGPFLRIMLSLPGQSHWLDIDAIRVREARDGAAILWGVRFQLLAVQVDGAIRRYILTHLSGADSVTRAESPAAPPARSRDPEPLSASLKHLLEGADDESDPGCENLELRVAYFEALQELAREQLARLRRLPLSQRKRPCA